MASPPRRMTRARAKKEGYEPDWRINPHWKTPKKSKRTTRFVVQDDVDLDSSVAHSSSSTGGAQRMPSPVKIRIAAKLPPLPQMEIPSTSSATLSEPTLSAVETNQRSINLGSPVRVRPRTEINYNTAADKENSSSATMLGAWTKSGKSTIPTTPAPISRSRPLEASPSSINTHPQPTSVKVLSTPVRILAPQTPGRPLGSARRIPLKVEKTKSAVYKLDPISDVSCPESHRDVSYRVNQRPQSPTKLAPSRTLVSPVKLQRSNTLPKQTKSFDLSASTHTNVSQQTTTEDHSSESKAWIPLKAVPTLQRPKSSFPNPPTRPVKSSTTNSPPRPVTKRDFYVDETFSVPLQTEPKSTQRASTPVPKFPIRRRSISQSSSPTPDKITPKTRIISNPVHFDSLEELKPITKVEKWKTPMKGAIHTPVQTVRKVCFRTPSMETPPVKEKEIQQLRKSLSILSLATPKVGDLPETSTTPIDTPRSPSSPKVFDLSDADDSSFELFTPRKGKISTVQQTPRTVTPDINVPSEKPDNVLSVARDAPFNIFTPKPSNVQPIMESPIVESPKLREVIPIHRTLTTPKVSPRKAFPQRDISVPIKDAHFETPAVTPKPPSATSSAKSMRTDKDVNKGPLNGVVAFVDVKTADGDDASAPFSESLKNLGARVVKQWTWNGDEVEKVGITHVIFKQGGPRTLAKVKLAKGAVKCVGLGWISRYFSLSQ